MPLFTEQELALAERKLQERTRLPFNRAIWFSNSLHALLRDDDRAQTGTPPQKVLAVDTTDIVAAITYSRPLFSAFTFGDLIAEEPEIRDDVPPERRHLPNFELEVLDKLILQHLLVHRKERYLLLDPYAEELNILRSAVKRDLQRTKDTLIVEGPLFGGRPDPFRGFSVENLDTIQKFIESRAPEEVPKQWGRFREEFLPHWRIDMLDTLSDKTKSFRSFERLATQGNFFYLRPSHYGARSLLNVAPLFEWSDYAKFVEDPEVGRQYVEIRETIQRLIGKVTRFRSKSKRQRDLSAERDARAFAIMHTLNSFFYRQKINARVELVSRSPTLHSVIAALPERALGQPDEQRLHVTLRHPFLLPDIYDFDARSLSAITSVLKGLDAIISGYLTDEGLVSRQTDAEMAANMRAAKRAARDAIPYLKDILAIQQGLEQDTEVVSEIYASTTKSAGSKASSKAANVELIDKLKIAFEAIAERLRSRSDPLTREAMVKLVEQNVAFVEHEAARTFAPGEITTFRVLDFRNIPATDQAFGTMPCLTTRVVGAANETFSRLIVIHSERMIAALSTRLPDINEPYDETKPTEMKVPVEVILDELRHALDAFSSRRSRDTLVYILDATLLACVVFASKRQFDAAILLASTILHPISGEIRWDRDRSTNTGDDARLGLAYRELFLLRHYCERGIAMKEYYGPPQSNVSISKNFARAQRDLDFATLMAEDAERVFSKGRGERDMAVSGTIRNFGDFRSNLAQLGAWTEQYLIITDWASKTEATRIEWQDDELRTLRRRIGIWAAAGFVRAILMDAHEARSRRAMLAGKSRSDGYQRRYLAYVEARALQGALTVFIIFLAYKIAPEMLEFWSLRDRPQRDRVLLFRSWRQWWKGYLELRERYNFSMRADTFIGVVCEALSKIADIKREARRRPGLQQIDAKIKAKHSTILGDLQRRLQRMVDDKDTSRFVRAISAAVINQVGVALTLAQ